MVALVPHREESPAHKLGSIIEVNVDAIKKLNRDETHKSFEREIKQHGFLPGLTHEGVEREGVEAAFDRVFDHVKEIWKQNFFSKELA